MTDWRSRAGTEFDCFKESAQGSRGMVVTNHPLGSSAGLEMLAMGGNAVDAAIASVFALSVVEPMMVGPLGGGYINVCLADGTTLCIDNYSLAPLAATADMYTPVSDEWPDYLLTENRESQLGHRAVGVPGNLRAWDEVHELHGHLDWAAVVQPAIRYAQHGFVVTDYLARLAAEHAADIERFADTARIFQPDGEQLQAGSVMKRPDLGRSLELIAAERSDALYQGELGQKLVSDMADNDGLITMEDLAGYRTLHNAPVRGTYRGVELIGPPPGNSGITLIIEMLNILENYDVAALGFGTPESLHLVLEVLKIAFADRFAYLGDPATVDIPLQWLTSKEYARTRLDGISADRAAAATAGTVGQGAESSYTTHLTTVDSAGNMVSMTQTINELFGSKVTVPGTGLLLNNTQAMFDPHPGHANSVAPAKRVVSSMAPIIARRDGRPWLGLGTPGGVRIFPSILQALVNIIDHGMSIQEAVEAPRVWTQGQDVELEAAFGQAIHDGLRQKGHQLTTVPNVAGGMNGIVVDHASGNMTGGACWRADGSPAALAGGYANAEVRFNPLVSDSD